MKTGDTLVVLESDGALRSRGIALEVESTRVLLQVGRARPSWVDRDLSRFGLTLEVEN
jgi:hypothetical protein